MARMIGGGGGINVGDLPVVVVLNWLYSGGGAMVFPELLLKLTLVGGLCPQNLLKAVLGDGVDVPGCSALA